MLTGKKVEVNLKFGIKTSISKNSDTPKSAVLYQEKKKSVLCSVGFSLLKIRGQLLNVIALHLKRWGRREGKHTLSHGPKALRFYFFPKFMGVLNKNVTVKEAGAVTFLRLSTQLGSYTWDTCRISSLGCLEKKLSSLQLILICAIAFSAPPVSPCLYQSPWEFYLSGIHQVQKKQMKLINSSYKFSSEASR